MKKLLFVLGLGLVFVACGDKAKEEATTEKQPESVIEVIETPVIVVEPQAEENKSDEAQTEATEENKSDEAQTEATEENKSDEAQTEATEENK